MKAATFIDTVYLLALLNPRDRWHDRALAVSQSITGPFVTTLAVLTEVADALAQRQHRRWAMESIDDIRNDENITCVAVTTEVFAAALRLYGDRPDKDWSLTDCVSFVVMREQRMTDALTADVHFTQAGFRALLLEA